MLNRLVFMLLALLIAQPAIAGAMVRLPAQLTQLDLASHLDYLEDPQGEYDLVDVLVEQPWAPSGGAFNRGYSRSAWWLRVTVANPDDRVRRHLLEVGSPLLDRLDIFVTEGGTVHQHYRLGDKQAFRERPIEHQGFVVPLVWQPRQTLELYVRVHSTSSLQVPLRLWDETVFAGVSNTRNMTAGFLFGGMILISGYNLLLFLVLRERLYLYYLGYALPMAVFLGSIDGYVFRYLWPEATVWNDQAVIVSQGLLTFFAILFARRLLDVQSLSRSLDLTSLAIMATAAGAVPLAWFAHYHVGIMVAIVASVAACCWGALAGPIAWRHSRPAGRNYTLAWGALFAGGVAMILWRTGIVAPSALTVYGLRVGVVLEMVLLSLALGERINAERQLRDRAQRQALQVAQRASIELERRVAERTRALEALNAQLSRLSNTDQLTGLYNRRHLERRLAEEWSRCRRNGQSLAVALIDVDHFKRINDTHGHQAGDSCLIEVARHLGAAARRAGDLAARYGGEEFCLLLPELDLAQGQALAEELRRTVEAAEVDAGSEQLRFTVSIGLAALVPAADGTADQLLRCADQALYRAKAEGRNRVCLYESASTATDA